MAEMVTGRDHNNLIRLPDDWAHTDGDTGPGRQMQPPMTPSEMQSDVKAAAQTRSSFDEVWKINFDAYRDTLVTVWLSDPVLHDEGGGFEFQDMPPLKLHIPVIKPVIDTVCASLATRAPEFVVIAERPEYEEAAKIAARITSWQWRLWGGIPAWRDATFDMAVCGHGIVKVAWELDEETEPVSDDEIEAQVQTALSETASAMLFDPNMQMPDERTLRNRFRREAENNPHVISFNEHPVYRRISPFDFYIDPEADSFRDAAWVAQRYWEPLSEVYKNEQYDPIARTMVKAQGRYTFHDLELDGESSGADDRYTRSVGSEHRGSAERAMLWEYHDRRSGTWAVFADGESDFLIEPRPGPFADTPFGVPYRMITRYDISEDLYPLGDVEPLLGSQMELDDTRTQMTLHRKQNARKWIVNSDTMADENNRAAMKSNLPDEVIIARGNLPIESLVQPVNPVQMSADFYMMGEIINAEVERISGVTELQRGIGASSSRRTASEVNLLDKGTTSRVAQQLVLHEEAAGDLGQMTIILMQKFLSAESLVPIIGPDGAEDWVKFSADDIAGQYHFQVRHGSMQPRDEQAERQTAVEFMQIAMPLVQMGVINPYGLARYLAKAYNLEDVEGLLMDMEQQEGFAAEQQMMAEAQAGGGGGGIGGGPSAPGNTSVSMMQGSGGPPTLPQGVPSGASPSSQGQGG